MLIEGISWDRGNESLADPPIKDTVSLMQRAYRKFRGEHDMMSAIREQVMAKGSPNAQVRVGRR